MASGDPLLQFRALDNEPPAANFATRSSLLAASADTDESLIPVLLFDPDANEHAEFSGVLPDNYDGGGLTITLFWTVDVGTGNVKWDATFKSFTTDVDNIITTAFGAAPSGNSVTAAAPSSNHDVINDDLTVTDGADMDSLAAGEYFRLRITRDAVDAADTVNSDDAELIAIYITET